MNVQRVMITWIQQMKDIAASNLMFITAKIKVKKSATKEAGYKNLDL